MQYMGGKHALAKRIVERIEHYRRGRVYLEPFVGGAHVLERVPQGAGRRAGDANEALVNLYADVQLGWDPPDSLTKEEWLELREKQDPHNPMTAFAGIGCSFMGMWFSSYADRAARAQRVLLRQRPLFDGVDFRPVNFCYWNPTDAMVYCDPPYANTEPYAGVKVPFDHAFFWQTMREWAEPERGNTVLVSEYVAPPGTECIAEWSVRGKLKRGGSSTERLFLVGDS